jgi:cysteinyl-tRNA synthetase
MDDDFNTSLAMAAIYELVKLINQARADGANDTQLGIAQSVFNELTSTLGLVLTEESSQGTSADAFIDLLVALRRDLRNEKNWAMSDKIRDELKALGVFLEDSKDGTTWSWES